MNSWVLHVKNYAKKHKCSYKDALTLAKATYKIGGNKGGIRGSDIIFKPPYEVSKAQPATEVHATTMADPFINIPTAQSYSIYDADQVNQLEYYVMFKIIQAGFGEHMAMSFIHYWTQIGRDITEILDWTPIKIRREMSRFRALRVTEL
jgi:hypothetical protein